MAGTAPHPLTAALTQGAAALPNIDPDLSDLLEREHLRQQRTLAMVAASSAADHTVLACEASTAANVTTEGYPGARYHAGCEVVDEIENLAIARARSVFGAQYANVQPHSGSTANYAVLTSLMSPGDTLLGLELSAGGHLTHGARAAFAGRYFHAVGYGTDAGGRIDYAQVARLAAEHRPRVIVCGASAYPRLIDFARFRAIADQVGAWLVADISHIAGLVAAGLHPSPIDHAHITTTSTYKQLYGPRGGLILLGADADTVVPTTSRTLSQTMQSAVFPFLQGTPSIGAIAAKARALDTVSRPEFRAVAQRILDDATALADAFTGRGYRLVTGGTDNHMVLIDVAERGLTGVIAERALESCGIVVNKNAIPGDRNGPRITSGVRLGTNSLALRGMDTLEMHTCAAAVDRVLSATVALDKTEFHLDPQVRLWARTQVEQLCDRFPLPDLFPVGLLQPA
jgi:glycine hydroxymethyltransferase